MESAKTLFLGFMPMLAGISWLISLIGAVTTGTATAINPLVSTFIPPFNGATSDYISHAAPIIQAQESLAFVNKCRTEKVGSSHSSYFLWRKIAIALKRAKIDIY
jgi:hypothetical protein